MPEKINYYSVLGVARNAPQDEIKKAYRRLVREYHPDSGNDHSVERFIEVREAYEVLGDPRSREAYDRRSETRRPLPRPSWFGVRSSDGGGIPWAGVRGRRDVWSETLGRSGRPGTGWIIPLEIELTPEEAFRGGLLNLRAPLPVRCQSCRGSGRWASVPCPACRGLGERVIEWPLALELPPMVSDETRRMIETEGPDGRPVQLSISIRIDWP